MQSVMLWFEIFDISDLISYEFHQHIYSRPLLFHVLAMNQSLDECDSSTVGRFKEVFD